MMIILPNKNDGLSALESKIDRFDFHRLSKSLIIKDLDVMIPKFKIEFDITLNESLKKVKSASQV